MTVYSLRKCFLESPSSQWSGSAGAIYPLVQRLERARLVEASAFSQGRRKSKKYAVTKPGLDALRHWIEPPFPPDAVSVTYDPLRSRLRFMGALTREQQERWFEEAATALAEVRQRVEAWDVQYDDVFSKMVTAHGRRDVAMRAQWLVEARAQILGAVQRPRDPDPLIPV